VVAAWGVHGALQDRGRIVQDGAPSPASAEPGPATPGTPSTSGPIPSPGRSDLHMQVARSAPRIAVLRPRIGTGPGIGSPDPRSGRSPGRTPAWALRSRCCGPRLTPSPDFFAPIEI
jgi:hypothetical protein